MFRIARRTIAIGPTMSAMPDATPDNSTAANLAATPGARPDATDAASAPTATDEAMIRRAIVLAEAAAAAGEVPVGAVIYHDDTIIAEGANRREIDQDPTAHAEMIALRSAAATLGSWRLDDCSIAVTLEPCPMCAGALVNARIVKLVYGASDPKMGCVRTLHRLCDEPRFNHRMTITPDVLAEPCAQLLTDFFQQRRGNNPPPKPRASRSDQTTRNDHAKHNEQE